MVNRKYSIHYPHTAPPVTLSSNESSFSFDPPASPRSAKTAEKTPIKFAFDGVTDANESNNLVANKSINNNKGKITRRMSYDAIKTLRTQNGPVRTMNGSKGSISPSPSVPISEVKRINPTRKMSSVSQSSTSTGTSSDLTTFPFDREAIDYERIQRECFAVEEEFDDGFVVQRPLHYDYDTDSPSYEALDQKIPPEGIFQQYTIFSQLEKDKFTKNLQSPANEMKILGNKKDHSSRKLNETSIHDQVVLSSAASSLTSPIPDLKIDFFAEATSSSTSPLAAKENVISSGGEKPAVDAALEMSQKDQFTLSTSSFSSKNSSINVTSNPMSTAVVTTPRATIVVQQVNEKFFVLKKY
jgi:hypothetical protein